MSEKISARFAEAYLTMVHDARYRPEAPSDGLGTVLLTADELRETGRLASEAQRYAEDLERQDRKGSFVLHGCTNWMQNKLFVYLLNATTLCFTGSGALPAQKRLLQSALREIEQIERDTN